MNDSRRDTRPHFNSAIPPRPAPLGSSVPAWRALAAEMVHTQLAHPADDRRPIRDRRVLDAFANVDRAAFVPPQLAHEAFADHPVPIGLGQTISQPYIQALQLEELGLTGRERVLEVGTGSGYQTALLTHLAREVYSIERLPDLMAAASAALGAVGIFDVHLRVGDGSQGWPEAAPFDAIVVCAGAPTIPKPLVEQLAIGGRLSIPVEEGDTAVQTMLLVTRRGLQADEVEIRRSIGCRFVKLIGKSAW